MLRYWLGLASLLLLPVLAGISWGRWVLLGLAIFYLAIRNVEGMAEARRARRELKLHLLDMPPSEPLPPLREDGSFDREATLAVLLRRRDDRLFPLIEAERRATGPRWYWKLIFGAVLWFEADDGWILTLLIFLTWAAWGHPSLPL
jgi:hypothetical protein